MEEKNINMSKLETRLKENGYMFDKEQEVTFGLRSSSVKLYVKPGTNCRIYISKEEIVSSNGVTNRELNKLKGYN
jgi:hypothetical protein